MPARMTCSINLASARFHSAPTTTFLSTYKQPQRQGFNRANYRTSVWALAVSGCAENTSVQNCGSDGGQVTERTGAFSALKFRSPKSGCVANIADRFCRVCGSDALTRGDTVFVSTAPSMRDVTLIEGLGHSELLVALQRGRRSGHNHEACGCPRGNYGGHIRV